MPSLFDHILTKLAELAAPAQKTAAQKSEPPSGPSSEPVLRIETGMHTAPIRRIGVDAANRFLVTASDDKTVRVWELATGRLLRVIRPPLGAGDEGKLYAVAISPDGQTIATGGWTSNQSGNVESIYLFDRESGRLLRRLAGLPDVVLHLTYSRDGRYLAAMLGGRNGVSVYQTADYALVGEDPDYGGDSYGADFDAANRLATVSYDSHVRLYDLGGSGLRLAAKQKVTGGNRPYSVRFSPDGARLAVGFSDSTQVNVLSGDTLSPPYAPDTSGVNSHALINIAWSADGSLLYAGGLYSDANNRKFIRIWVDGGRGSYRDILLDAASTIFHILPLRGGGVVYGAGDPSFGGLDAGGRRALFIAPAIADYRGNCEGFLLSPDGMTVQFAFEKFGKSPARFSLSDRRLEVAPPPGASQLQPPVTEADGLKVTDWENTYEPKLNGTPLKLDQYEVSRSLAVAPDRQKFLIGASFWLRLFDRGGAELWRVAIPGEVWAVNVSGDGRYAVAAYGDGTIRWHSMADGRELLAFFPHADQKRWVVWTPSGYYDVSPGAEDLIGWHVNQGRDEEADFFPVGQFRETFYRPDVVAKILGTGDEAAALKAANAEAGRKRQEADVAKMLPPVVEIVSPSDGAEVQVNEVTVRFTLRTPSGEPVTEVKVLVDGRPVDTGRDIGLQTAGSDSSAPREVLVAVPEGESLVSVIASNRFTTSVPATVRVRKAQAAVSPGDRRHARLPPAEAGEAFEIKPKLYALAVGVSNYTDAKLKLSFAAKDARDFVAALEGQNGGLYRDVVFKVLTDEQATKDEILDGLDWIQRETTSKDVAMILFAGHGVNDRNGRYFFLPCNTDVGKLLRTGVSFEDIKNTVAVLAGKTLFFIDTCHSGSVFGGRRAISLDIVGVVNELASAQNGAVVFAASTGNQYSLEDAAWGNGAFTLAVVEGFRGRADYGGKGRITVNMLDLYISERVKELTAGQQTPTTAKPSTVPDFPIALKK